MAGRSTEETFSRRWFFENYTLEKLEKGELNKVWKEPTNRQRQHLVGALVCNDYDRNATNYLWDPETGDLCLFDFVDPVTHPVGAGTLQMVIARLIKSNDSVGTFNQGIELAQERLTDGVLLGIVQRSGLQGDRAKKTLDSLCERRDNIEGHLLEVLRISSQWV